MNTLEERFITFEGRPLRYLIGGSGPPMLLCHGFIGSAENFDDWLTVLTPRRTVVVPDLPGFGKSAPLPGAHHVEALAGAVLAAADHAGTQRYDLAGLCLGAGVALAVQRARPEAAARLVLHTPLLTPSLVRRRFHLQVGIMLAPIVFSAIVWLSRQRLVSDLYKRLMVEGGNVDPAAAQVNFDNQLRAHPRAAREWLREGLRRNDLRQVLDSAARVLIIVAQDDRIVEVRMLDEAVRGARNVELAVVTEGGHAWTHAMIQRQCAIIGAFLDDRPLPLPETASAA